MSANRLIIEWLLLLLFAYVLAIASAVYQLNDRLDSRLLDFAVSLVQVEQPDDIVIVAIDEQSLQQIGAWPWPRERHAELIAGLHKAGARQIIYDVLFVEQTDAASDAALAASIAEAGTVILPHSFIAEPNSESGIIAEQPLPMLADAARGLGHVAATPDTDGTLRRFSLVQDAGGEAYNHLVVSALAASQLPFAWHDRSIPPVVPFQKAGTIPAVSAAQIINGTIDPDFIRGQTIFVGATAMGMGDRFTVPGSDGRTMPGVETQANFFHSAREGVLVAVASLGWSIALAIIAVTLLFMAFWQFDPKRGLVATIAIILGALAISISLVPLTKLWISPAPALVVLLASYPLWNWRRLTAISAYLEREASRLEPASSKPTTGSGFDIVARQVDRMRNLLRDVTDSFSFLRDVIELAPDAMLVFDREGRLEMMNRKAAVLFPDWAIADERPTLPEMLLVARCEFDTHKQEIVTAEGQTLLLAQSAFQMSTDTPAGEIVSLRDISQLRQQENERKQMLEFLSHDMRTPQAAIIGLTKQVAQGRPGDTERMDRIRAQAERTLKLADDFVQIARMEEAELNAEEADLVSLAEEACDRIYTLSRDAGVSIVGEFPDTPLFAMIDASIIARLLDNLLGNAVKFSPSGSEVTVRLLENAKSGIEITVSDQGPGLPPERVKDTFARFGAHEHQALPSAGLGLTFVKRAVDLHNGTIEVITAQGEGTSFRIVLPGCVSTEAQSD